MGATSTEGTSGGNFENPEAGSCAARCYGVVEIGTHEEEYKGKVSDKKKLLIFFELDQRMEDGRPFVVNKWYTNSLSEKANLRKDLKAWRGRDFTDAELKKFELKKIINQPCLLNLSKNDNNKISVGSIMPLPKGMSAPPLENDTIDFGIDDIGNKDLWDQLYPWVQEKIMSSKEWELLNNEEEPESQEEDGEIPF